MISKGAADGAKILIYARLTRLSYGQLDRDRPSANLGAPLLEQLILDKLHILVRIELVRLTFPGSYTNNKSWFLGDIILRVAPVPKRCYRDRFSERSAVWALVSGLPSAQRRVRRIMVLQAYIDDSGEQEEAVNPVFVLAGFIADSARWAAFLDEWNAALAASPSIAYFKMKEADRLDGEFDRHRRWTKSMRDEKMAVLLPIIQKHVQARVSVSI